MRYLEGGEALLIHARILDATGGAHGVRDAHLLGSILEKPRMRLGGKALYPSLFDKAAAYFEAFANYHVFIDGNKRTALGATARFLFLNRYILKAAAADAESFALEVALKKHTLKEIARWLKKNSARAAKAGGPTIRSRTA